MDQTQEDQTQGPQDGSEDGSTGSGTGASAAEQVRFQGRELRTARNTWRRERERVERERESVGRGEGAVLAAGQHSMPA
jgi:hypothetical protein